VIESVIFQYIKNTPDYHNHELTGDMQEMVVLNLFRFCHMAKGF
jgi:hypothetical protein